MRSKDNLWRCHLKSYRWRSGRSFAREKNRVHLFYNNINTQITCSALLILAPVTFAHRLPILTSRVSFRRLYVCAVRVCVFFFLFFRRLIHRRMRLLRMHIGSKNKLKFKYVYAIILCARICATVSLHYYYYCTMQDARMYCIMYIYCIVRRRKIPCDAEMAGRYTGMLSSLLMNQSANVIPSAAASSIPNISTEQKWISNNLLWMCNK